MAIVVMPYDMLEFNKYAVELMSGKYIDANDHKNDIKP